MNINHDRLGRFAARTGSGIGDRISRFNSIRTDSKFTVGKTSFKSASPESFINARKVLSASGQKFLTQYTAKELQDAQSKLFLSKDGKTGFALHAGDELVNLFSYGSKGAGSDAVILAIKLGARRLDCLDLKPKGLKTYYEKFGFKEERREANWTLGEPDVIYMRKS